MQKKKGVITLEQSKLNQLITLENKILADRRSLAELTSQLNGHNSEYVNNKIAMLEQDLAYMSKEISQLKNSYASPGYARPAMPAQPIVQQGMPMQPMDRPPLPMQPMDRPPLPMQPARPTFAQSNQVQPMERAGQPMGAPMGRPPMQQLGNNYGPIMQDREMANPAYRQYNPNMQNKYPNKESDFEKTFGKSFMGIAASVLIFISIILFATLLLPKLNDTAKMVIMYLVSAGFLGAGTYRLRKDRDNKFNISLTGCGLGALFISLLLSNIYFKALGDIPLYVLIAFWGGLVCLYAKKDNFVFQIIGELGILIATIFGCILCIETSDPAKFVALLIFYAITSAIFYIVNYGREFEENLCYHFYAFGGTVILSVACMIMEGDKWQICRIIALIIQILNMAAVLTHKLNKQQEWMGVFASSHLISLAVISGFTIGNIETWGIVAYIICMIMVFGLSWVKSENRVGVEMLTFTAIILSLIGLCVNGDAYKYGVVWLMIIPLIVYGYFRNDILYKGSGLGILLIHLFIFDYDNKGLHFIFMFVALAVIYLCMFFFKKQYNRTFKECIHIVALLFIATQMGGALEEAFGVSETGGQSSAIILTVVYICFFLLNTVAYKSKFATNFATGEKEGNGDVYVVANMVAMGWGTYMMCENSYAVLHFINILVAFAAFMIGTKASLDREGDNVLRNIYVGLKFTLYLIVMLTSFDSPNFIVSIGCLLLAILLIVVGFVGEYKYLRIYGLVLTMISIFKLIMIDAHYENTLGNAISFFVSGMLCFGISMLYNYLDKKINKDE